MPCPWQMSLGNALVQGQCAVRCIQSVVVTGMPRISVAKIGLGKSLQRPSFGKFRVKLRRLFAQSDDPELTATFAEIAVDPTLPGHEVEVIGVGIAGTAILERLFLLRQELELERGDDFLRDFVLDGEDVGQFAVVALGPDMAAGLAVDQLGGDPDPLPRLAHAAFEHVADAQFARDIGDINRLALEGEGGVARDDLQRRDLAQVGRDVLADPVAEIFLLGIATHVHERKHAHRRPLAPCCPLADLPRSRTARSQGGDAALRPCASPELPASPSHP